MMLITVMMTMTVAILRLKMLHVLPDRHLRRNQARSQNRHQSQYCQYSHYRCLFPFEYQCQFRSDQFSLSSHFLFLLFHSYG